MTWTLMGFFIAAALAVPLYRLFRPAPLTGVVVQASKRALAVYRAQLDEIERDLERGKITPEFAEGARLEVQRRMLRADEQEGDKGPTSQPVGRAVAAVIVVLVLAGSVALYLDLGHPGYGSPSDELPPNHPPLGASEGAQNPHGGPTLDEALSKLEVHLASNPDDLEGWSLLGRVLLQAGRSREAADAYRRAVEVNGDSADLWVGLGEALVDTLDGFISPAAQYAFVEAARLDPGHPAPRYYSGLSHYLNNDPEAALAIWRPLAEEADPEAGWLPSLRMQIRRAEMELGGAGAPDASAVAEMSADEQAAFIQTMVARLESRLEEDPEDGDGWYRLARAYKVLGREADAETALEKALALAPEAERARLEAEFRSVPTQR